MSAPIVFKRCECEVEPGKFNIGQLSLNCPTVWRLVAAGYTTGVFQLERQLGSDWAQKIKPTSVEQLADLVALIRPGCLESGMTEMYRRVKMGEQPAEYLHPALKPILEATFGCLIYQEQAIRVAVELADFSLAEADGLRKCVTGDTLFLSRKRGWISVERLLAEGYKRDHFLIMDETGSQQWRKIEKIWSTGLRDVQLTETQSGFRIRSTRRHRLLTARGWAAAGRLTAGQDHLVAVKAIEYEGRDDVSTDMAVALAGTISEEYFSETEASNHKRPYGSFASHDSALMATFQNAVIRAFGQPVRSQSGKTAVRMPPGLDPHVRASLGSGVPRSRALPDCLMGMTKAGLRPALSFLLACEGQAHEDGRFEFPSASRMLISQVKLLLLRFGVQSLIRQCACGGYGTHWRLCIDRRQDQLALLAELTGEWPEHKKNALRRAAVFTGRRPGALINSMPRSVVRQMVEQCSPGAGIDRALTRQRFLQIANNPHWRQFAEGAQHFDAVQILRPQVGPVEAFDFTVAGGDAPYIVANGLVIHNSIGKKIPEEMTKLKARFLAKAEAKGLVTRGQAEEIFGWIEKFQRYGFNRCVAASTRVRRPGHNSHMPLGGYTVEEMYRIRHDLDYAKATGCGRLQRKWNGQGHYGYSFSLGGDGRVRQNLIRDIQPAGRRLVYRISLSNGMFIDATGNHRFPTANGEKTCDELLVGDQLWTYGDNRDGHLAAPVAIATIKPWGSAATYDVTMDAPHHNFVTGDGIVTCNSHAVSYGMLAYRTAWLKCHFPGEFFTSYLTFAGHKADPKEEMNRLVQDARLFGLSVLLPDIRRRNINFELTGERKAIAFGLGHIHGVGQSAIEKITATPDLDTWPKFLAAVPHLHRNVGEALIRSGACDGYELPRSQMIRDLEVILGTTVRDEHGKACEIRGLTPKERDAFFARHDGLRSAADVLEEMVRAAQQSSGQSASAMTKAAIIQKLVSLGCEASSLSSMNKADLVKTFRERIASLPPRPRINESRRAVLLDKVQSLQGPAADTHLARSAAEKHYLGVALSCSPADAADPSLASHTCLEAARSPNGTTVRICAVVDRVKLTRTKRGRNPGKSMCFLDLSDSTYSLDHAVVFPDVYRHNKAVCKEGSVVLATGEIRSRSLVVNDLQRLL